jgi:hypothetical protein
MRKNSVCCYDRLFLLSTSMENVRAWKERRMSMRKNDERNIGEKERIDESEGNEYKRDKEAILY